MKVLLVITIAIAQISQVLLQKGPSHEIACVKPCLKALKNAHQASLQRAKCKVSTQGLSLRQLTKKFDIPANISKRDFLELGNSLSDWKLLKSRRSRFKNAYREFIRIAENHFNVEQDLKELANKHPELFQALSQVKDLKGHIVPIYIGRIAYAAELRTHTGNFEQGGTEFHFRKGKLYTYQSLSKPDLGSRPGITIWLENANLNVLAHEGGHVLSFFGGNEALGIPGIPYGSPGNPRSIQDFWQNYRFWMGQCHLCRANANNPLNPTCHAAILAENLPSSNKGFQRCSFDFSLYTQGLDLPNDF